MEFLVQFDLTIPEGVDQAEAAARTEAEGAASADLARAGHLGRLWTVSRAPGRWRGLGLYRADSEQQLEGMLRALPLYGWMQVAVTPLEAHAHDPGPAPPIQSFASGRMR